LLSETWPKRWGPWVAAVLQTGVNIGVLLACVTTYLMAGQNPRWVFLVGILPALMVFWIRRAVPEPDEWHRAKAEARYQPPVSDLFRGDVLPITVKTILVCSLTLTAWWAFQFWNQQHLRNLPELAPWTVQQREQLVSKSFFIVIAPAIVGNFLAGWLASLFGFRRAIALMCLGFFTSFMGAYAVPRDYNAIIVWLALIGVFSGVFGLFTMYLPPLFPTLLRTTGAGFCYNIGRIAAAFGTVFFGLFSQVGDFRVALFSVGFLVPVAMIFAWILPELKIDKH
jgi:MFS family permease